MINLKAPAKINLFLEVTAERPDGYHELSTLFAKVGLYDELEFEKNPGGIKLLIDGFIPGQKDTLNFSDNIIYKAAAAFLDSFAIKSGVTIRLKKNIPVGAGLGGGSSDGACALKGMSALFGLGKDRTGKLGEIAAGLGSDVPFFISDSTFAAGLGRGEIIEPVEFTGALPYIILVYPGIPVYTRDVYGKLKIAGRPEISTKLEIFEKLKSSLSAGKFMSGYKGLLFNRLEDPVLAGYPQVLSAKERLLSAGADAALMSGSGSTVFGLADNLHKADGIVSALSSNKNYKVFRINFC